MRQQHVIQSKRTSIMHMLADGASHRTIEEMLDVRRETVLFFASLRDVTRQDSRPRGRAAMRVAAVPPEIASIRDELTRDYFNMSDERRGEILTTLREFVRRVSPHRQTHRPWKMELTLELAALHCWGCPPRLLSEDFE